MREARRSLADIAQAKEAADRQAWRLAEKGPAMPPAKQRGAIYFVTAGNNVKIGFTQNSNVSRRMGYLQTGNPIELTLIRLIKPAWFMQEQWLHWYFERYHRHGEWFLFCDEMLSINPPIPINYSKYLLPHSPVDYSSAAESQTPVAHSGEALTKIMDRLRERTPSRAELLAKFRR
jgi:hypothetical protein